MADEPGAEKRVAASGTDERAGSRGSTARQLEPARADLERARADRAEEDARRAEREALATRLELARVTAELAAERRRFDALLRRRSVRAARAASRAVRSIAALVNRGSRSPDRRPRTPPAARRVDALEPDGGRSMAAAYRASRLAALRGEPGSGGRRIAVAVVAASGASSDVRTDAARRLADALEARGLDPRCVDSAEAIDPSVDVVVAVDPSADPLAFPVGPVRVAAWPRPAVPPDPGEWDVVVGAASDLGVAVTDALAGWLRARRVGIRLPAGSARTADSWGDTYLARDLRAAFRQAGWPARIHFSKDWDDAAIGRDDVVVDLVGVYEPKSRHGACRVLWQISHPELATARLYSTYDLVFVASDRFAALMAGRVDVPVQPLHQATDPARFRPDPSGPAHQLLFVANWREGGRPILDDLLPTEHELAVYGRGWTPDRLDPRYHAGDHIPNDELAGYYAGAAIVLNDHWSAMRREGFLSNRLYDAAAAGALVITDDVEGLDAEFDGGVLGYRDRPHLLELIEQHLADPELRRRTSERARRAVLTRHTFAHRVRSIISAVEPVLAEAESERRA